MDLKLHGEIVDADSKQFKINWLCIGKNDVSYKDLDEALESKSEDDRLIKVDINCPGGSCIEGLAIYDRLRSLDGHIIEANVRGECSSMATIVLCAASRRIAQPNARFCIHKPRYLDYQTRVLTENDALRLYEDLHEETERLKAIYIERTSMTAEQVEELMMQDKYITSEEALKIGLITDIAEPKTACKISNNQIMQKKIKSWQKTVMSAIGLGNYIEAMEEETVAMTLNTEDGSTIEVQREEGEPQVGDIASPDGEHVMSNGTTIVITDGVITEIRAAEELQEDDGQEAKNDADMEASLSAMSDKIKTLSLENEELRRQLAESKTKEKSDVEAKILQLVANAGGLKWLESLESDYKPEPRTVTDSKLAADAERERMLAEAREKYSKR